MKNKRNLNKIVFLIALATLLLASLACGADATPEFVAASTPPTNLDNSILESTPAPQIVLQNGETVVGWWSRVGGNGNFREVVEFRSDGTYITGICMLQIQNDWCDEGKAVAQIQGNYSLDSDILALQNGLMWQESLDDFLQGDSAVVDLSKVHPEVYQWLLEVIPDNPPTGNPPVKVLHLIAANNQIRQFDDYRVTPPGWLMR